MNLIEALKTGLPYKYKTWPNYVENTSAIRLHLDKEIMTSDDWEVQSEIIELTSADYFNSVSNWAKSKYSKTKTYSSEEQFVTWVIDNCQDLWQEIKKNGKIKD